MEVDEGEAADIILEPGEMSLHHVLIVHGSRPNAAADRRIGYAIRYIPTRVRQVAGPRDSATLVRGQDAFGHFDLEPRAGRRPRSGGARPPRRHQRSAGADPLPGHDADELLRARAVTSGLPANEVSGRDAGEGDQVGARTGQSAGSLQAER